MFFKGARGTVRGTIFDVQRFSLHDGPGIRTTIFTKGCPLSCFWCQNPESISPRPQLMHFDSRCTVCGLCLDACDRGVFVGPGLPGGRALCNFCARCVQRCPGDALAICGRDVDAMEVVSEAVSDAVFAEESGGGITISGGEPLYQPRFSKELAILARREGLHVALDTSGYAPWPTLRSMIRHVDLFLYDIKHMESTRHLKATGVGNELILRNLRLLDGEGAPIRIRLPIIPGFNDSIKNVHHMCDLISKLHTVQHVDILPFHNLGASKWKALGLRYSAEAYTQPSKQKLSNISSVLSDSGLDVTVH